MQMNTRNPAQSPRTHEGGEARVISVSAQLRRAVLSTLLWEDGFYESGESIATRIKDLTRQVGRAEAEAILSEAKHGQKLRHAPLWMAVAMVREGWLGKDSLAGLITRADDLTEFLSLYWAEGKCPLSHPVRKGLSLAMARFDEYQFAKYDRDTPIKLRDAFRLVRPKPATPAQSELWRRLVQGELEAPDTWEVALSAGSDKKTTFERLLTERRLPDVAFVRNLRNMVESGVDRKLIKASFASREWRWLLPFQFVTAARMVPSWEPELEAAMLRSLAGMEKIGGRVAVLVDGSGSMAERLSRRSDTTRFDAACGLAILAREVCSDVEIWRFNDAVKRVPARHGFALRDALGRAEGGTRMWDAMRAIAGREKWDVVLVITDEQTADNGKVEDVRADHIAIVNVAANRNGVGYGQAIVHIDGWSENAVTYLREYLKHPL